MTIDDKLKDCEHKVLFYIPQYMDKKDITVPNYRCNDCRELMYSTYYGGKLDVKQYEVKVIAYNGLTLEKKVLKG